MSFEKIDVDIKTISDERGTLSVVQNSELPFEIKRIFWIYNVKEGEERGNHANHESKQLFVCLKGSCKIMMDDGKEKKEIILNDTKKGLFVEPKIWRTLYEFSPDAIVLVLASTEYKEEEYIRDYEKFKEAVS